MKDLTKFIFELGHLRKISHEGWKLIGVHEPESVAEHTLRTAQIGYILSYLEGYINPMEVCTICVFHDISECRIGDIHKVANRYLTKNESEVVKDQTKNLGPIGVSLQHLWNQSENLETSAAIIAKDADLLEMAFTAREYQVLGYCEASDWLENISNNLKTRSAQQLLTILKEMNPYTWWHGLKKISKS